MSSPNPHDHDRSDSDYGQKSAKHKALRKKLNPAQLAAKRMLGYAGKEMSENKRKAGEAPLQHLKRLIK